MARDILSEANMSASRAKCTGCSRISSGPSTFFLLFKMAMSPLVMSLASPGAVQILNKTTVLSNNSARESSEMIMAACTAVTLRFSINRVRRADGNSGSVLLISAMSTYRKTEEKNAESFIVSLLRRRHIRQSFVQSINQSINQSNNQ